MKILKKIGKWVLVKPLALLIPLVMFLAGWWMALPSEDSSGDDMEATADEVWTCSMHPQIRQPKAGLCPICNMDLILLADDGPTSGLRELAVSDEAAALLDLRVSPVIAGAAGVKVELFGKIAYDERKMVKTTARMAGRLDRLFADFEGTQVSKGDALGEIYSPELYVAQQELIQAVKSVREGSGSDSVSKVRRNLLQAAREKLRLLELSNDQIAAIEKLGKPSDRITLLAPQSGIVVKRFVSEGQYLKTGDPLFTVVNLESVWLYLEAYESDLPWLRYGQDVKFSVEALPGREFHGRIAFIDPELDSKRRVVRLRVNVANDQRLLKPGMFVQAEVEAKVLSDGLVLDPDLAGKWISPMHPEIVKDEPGVCDICGMPLVKAETLGFVARVKEAGKSLLVPVSAVLQTGDRAVVYVRKPGDKVVFEGREIVLGARAGDQFIVRSGLMEGDLVATNGALKLDSELQIKAKPSMMNPNAGLKERPAKEAPMVVKAYWGPVARRFADFRAAVVSEDEVAGKIALERMRYALKNVKSEGLSAEDGALWAEFSMRLMNSIVVAEGVVAKSPRLAFGELEDTMREVGRYVGLDWDVETPIMMASWMKPVEALVTAYVEVAGGLAEDEFARAKSGMENLKVAIDGLPSDAAKTGLLESYSELKGEGEVGEFRKKFAMFSKKVVAVVRRHGGDLGGDVYVVHCPMASGGDGADWLSREPMVKNPYFGDKMYDCGMVMDTLSLDFTKKVQGDEKMEKMHQHEGMKMEVDGE